MSHASARVVDFSSFSLAAWESVAPERRTPMQQYIWVRAAAETLSAGRPVQVVTVGSVDKPQALAPLAVSITGARRLRLLGAEELSESVEVHYCDEEALVAMAKGLAKLGLPLNFGHYLEDTPFLPALRAAYRGRGLVVAKPLPSRGCPYIILGDGWLEPEQNFTARRRSDFRRMQRNAEKLGKVTFDILQPRIEEVGSLFDEAMAIEARGWKGRSGTAIAIDRRLADFYRRYTQLACEAGILRLCFMRVDGKAIAMQLAVETERRFWLFKIGYDEAFAKCSPGNLLLRETISYAARRELKSYEFLGKEAAWTELWTKSAHPIVALRTYTANPAGVSALLVDGMHQLRQRCRFFTDKFAATRASQARPSHA
jgi:hypothetical protein